MIAASQHGTTIGGLLLVLAVVVAGSLAFYFAPEIQRVQRWWADRRSIRRTARQSVRAVRGLGAQLLADEAKLRESGGAR